MPPCDERLALESTALDQADGDDDDGEHEKDVDEPSHGVAADEAEQPKDDQDNGDGVDHGVRSGVVVL